MTEPAEPAPASSAAEFDFEWEGALDPEIATPAGAVGANRLLARRIGCANGHDSDAAKEVRRGEVPRSSPDSIRWVQRSLNEVLRLRLAEDGVAGPSTRSAIRNFQRREWLPVTGTIGPDSERMLIAETGAIPNPVYHADQEALEDEEASF
jgi:peptidoglycan hydrolase-like protein with peptidoglycan-binding domain